MATVLLDVMRVQKSAWKKREELRFQCGGLGGEILWVHFQNFTVFDPLFSTWIHPRQVLGVVHIEEKLVCSRKIND